MIIFEGWCSSEGFHRAPQCTEYTGAPLKCLWTNACCIRNKQEELDVLAQLQSYSIIGISKT